MVVAAYQQQTLVLHADGAAWATRLRYRTRELLTLFRARLPELRTIQVKNRPVAPFSRHARRPPGVAGDTVAGIRQTADDIADPSLRSVLHRIADTIANAPATEASVSSSPS